MPVQIAYREVKNRASCNLPFTDNMVLFGYLGYGYNWYLKKVWYLSSILSSPSLKIRSKQGSLPFYTILMDGHTIWASFQFLF